MTGYEEQLMGGRQRTTTALRNNLVDSDDWIVLIQTAKTLTEWATTDTTITDWLTPRLRELAADSRKSVSGKAGKLLHQLNTD